MKITVLGTGTSQGVPVIACQCLVCLSTDVRDKRLRCAVLIEVGGKNLLVDAGPDFRQQMLVHQVKKLDAVLLTHEHADHIFGLDDIRSFNWISQVPMDIFCEHRVAMELRTIFRYAFSPTSYPGTPKMDLHEIGTEPFDLKGIRIIPIRLWHHKLPVLGFRIGNFAYLTDFSRIDPPELEKLAGLEVLMICALRKHTHIAHLNLEEALALIRQINPRKSYLTHFSHEMGKHADLLTELPDGVEPGWDGLRIEL